MGTDRCGFRLRLDAWTADLPDHEARATPDVTDGLRETAPGGDDAWRCSRPETEPDGRCPVHSERSDDGAATGAVLAAFDADPNGPGAGDGPGPAKRFVGLTADRLALDGKRLRGSATGPLDLRGATVGCLDLAGTDLGCGLRLDGATVGELRLGDTTLGGELSARRARIGDVEAEGVTGAAGLRFVCADLGTVDVSGADLAGRGDFGFSTLEALTAEKAEVRGRLSLKEATVAGDADCRGLTVRGPDPHSDIPGLQFRRADVEGRLTLAEVDCEGALIGYELAVGDDLDCAGFRVADQVMLGGIHDDEAMLGPARVGGSVSFQGARVGDWLRFAGSDDGFYPGPRVRGTVDCRDADLAAAEFDPSGPAAGLALVDLRGATLDRGWLGRSDGRTVYDCTGTTLGDVSLDSREGDPTEGVRMVETTFDGFRFVAERRLLSRVDWAVHALDPAQRRTVAVGRQYPAAVDLARDVAAACAADPALAAWLADGTGTIDVRGFAERTFDGFDDEALAEVSRHGPESRLADVLGTRERYRRGAFAYLAEAVRFGGENPLTILLSDASTSRDVRALAEAVEAVAPEPKPSMSHRPLRRRLRSAGLTGARALATADGGADAVTPDLSERASTYLAARNGADAVGDSVAAGEFFVKELGVRRAQHWATLTDRNRDVDPLGRLRAAYDWASNAALFVSAGYGERPSYTFVLSWLTVGLFALLFWRVTALPGVQVGPTYEGLRGAFLLSMEGFVTLVLGGATVESGLVRLLGNLEGFLGAFLIALFVFALTRSLDR